jgi:hypothetical protein
MRTIDAEIAATVHYVAGEFEDRSVHPSEWEVFGAVQAWKANRKPPLEEEDVALAIRSLNLLGWVGLSPSSELPLPR